MKSIRTKITILNVIGITVAIAATTIISAISVAKQGHENAEQALSLYCQIGRDNLNNYFKSVEQSVKTVSSLIDTDLDNIEEDHFNDQFTAHMHNADIIFKDAALNTTGVLTYYYRIDPSISTLTGEEGFWYTNLDGEGFKPHAVTPIVDDQTCPWFWIPKHENKAVWLLPYDTDSLDAVTVLSYNFPVKRNGSFVGVVGIEISYNTLGEQTNSIKVQETGFAYVIENKTCSIIYHPYIDILGMPEEDRPAIPSEFIKQFKNNNHHVEYTFKGVEKHSYWLDLGNGMSVVVAVPIKEVSRIWLNVVLKIVLVSLGIVAAFAIVSILYTRRITRPLKELTIAAEKINEGDYDVNLKYKDNDEIGTLTQTVNKLVTHLGEYIEDLSNLAYEDALTSVKNRSAYNLALEEIQSRIENKEHDIRFAIAIFDCDNLKEVNDKYGHDKGNVYLKNSCLLITRVFQHSDVYRLGGDEFAVILQGEDFKNREKLKKSFLERSAEICSLAKEEWEKIRVSVGVACYDPEVDNSAKDVAIHADHLMYQNKRERKRKAR